MKNLLKQFTQLTTKSKNELPHSDTDSETSSESVPEANTQYDPKTKERIHRLIQNISQSPDAFDSILTKLGTGKFSFLGGQGLTKLIEKDLAGKRYDIFTAAGLLYASFGTKGMLPGLLRNGLLTELASIDKPNAEAILNKVTEHSFFKDNMALLGINESIMPPHQIKEIVNSFITLINIINQSNPQKLESLGTSLSYLLENNQRMKRLQEKIERNNKKLESSHNNVKYTNKSILLKGEISNLETTISLTNSKIINNIISNLETNESRVQITAFTLSLASCFAKSLDNLIISEEKNLALEKIQKFNEQINKAEEEKQDISAIVAQRDSLIINNKITIFEQFSYFTKKAIELEQDAKLNELVSLAEPTISAILSHPLELLKISEALKEFAENPKKQLSNLVFTAMSLLKHDDVLSALMDPEKILKINNSLGSDKVSLANKFIEIFTADYAIDNIMGDQGLGNILPRIVNLVKVQQFSKLSPQDAEQFKAIVPDAINYLKSVTQAAITHPDEINAIALAFQNYSNAKDKAEKLPNLVQSSLNLLGKQDIMNAAFDSSIATKALDLKKLQETLKITKQDAEQFKAIVPDAINYLKSVTQAAITHPDEINAIALAFQNYSNAKDKAEKLPNLVQSSLNLLGKQDIMNAAFDSSIATKALDLKKLQETLKITKQDAEQFKAIVPDAINYLKSATQAAINHPDEINAIALAFQNYSDAKDKAEKLPNLVQSSLNLLGKQDVIESLSNEESIDNLISKTSQIPKMQEYFNHFKKDLSPLKAAIKDATPKLIKIFKEGIKLEHNKEILIKAEALLHAPIDNKKLKALAIEAIDLYSKNPPILKSLVEEINLSRKDISKIIDKSLSSIKKDTYTLRLLKPLGINGDFITSVLEKTINEKGLEALKKFADSPSMMNAVYIISATGNLSAVISHVFKSGLNYLIDKTLNKETFKSVEKPALIPVEKWTEKVKINNPTTIRSRN